MIKIELEDTAKLMLSKNYINRFIAEYWQLAIRTKKLERMLEQLKEGKLDFQPQNPEDLLQHQLDVMKEYLFILEERAKNEHIDLTATACDAN